MVKEFAGLIFVFSLVLVLSQQSFAQGFTRSIDSLWAQYHSGVEEQKQIDLLNEISYAYRRVAPDSTMKYAQGALERAQKLQYSQGLAIAYKNKGIAHYKFGSPSDTTIYYYDLAIASATLSEDYYTLAACYNNIALINILEFSYNQAIERLLRGIEVFDKYIKKDNRLKALMLANLGGAYNESGDIEKGISYYEQGLAMAAELGEESIRSIFMDELARAKVSVGRIEEAKRDVEAVLTLQDQLSDFESKVDALLALSEIYTKQQDGATAVKYGQQAMNLASEQGFTRMRVQTQIQLFHAYQEQNNEDKAIEYLQKANKESIQRGYLKLEVETFQLLAEAFAKRQDFSRAYEYLIAYNAAKSRQVSKTTSEQAAELEARYQVEERERQIALLHQRQEVQRERIQLLFIAIGVFVILLLVAIYFYLQKARTSKALNEKNKALAEVERELKERNQELQRYIASNLELENFAHLASHDLREPMRTIVSFSQLLERSTREKLNTTEQEYLSFVQQGIRRIERLVNDLLAFSIVNNTSPVFEKINCDEVLKLVVSDLQQLISEKRAQVKILDTPSILMADKSRIYRVFQNLLTNAIKYSKPNITPVISIAGKSTNTHHHFYVTDNGIGIDPEQHQKIFLLFKTLHNKSVTNSSGIGLAICKKIVEQHGGKVWLESKPGEGSTFHFTIAREQGNS